MANTFYLKHLETMRLPNKVTTNFPCSISENGQISIISLNCLLVFQVCTIKDNNLPNVSMKKMSIQPSNFILANNIDIDPNDFLEELPKAELYEAVLRTDLTPSLRAGSSLEPKFIKVSWSPSQLIGHYDCAIATLTNTGSLEVFIKKFDNSYYEEFVSIANITQMYIERCKAGWKGIAKLRPLEKFNALKDRVEHIRPTAFTWSHNIAEKPTFCILIVAHACGLVTFWKANTIEINKLEIVDVTFLAEYSTDLKHITSIVWKESGEKALLFAGNLEGNVKIFLITSITERNITIDGEVILWPENDQLKVEHISLLIDEGLLFVIVAKGTDLIIYLINSQGQHIDSCVFHVGNLEITGIEKIDKNRLLVVTLTGAVKELKLSCVDSKISIDWRHIYININWYLYQPLGVVTSRNKVFFAFLTAPCKTADTKDDRVLNDLVIFFNTEKDPLDMLLKNPTNSLRNYWDCLEVLRLSAVIDKQFPCKLALEENYDRFPLYKLKIYLWVSKIYDLICEQSGCIKDYIKSYNDILFMINIRMIILRMKYLLRQMENGTALSTFQLQNLNILNNYMKQIVLEDIIPKLELSDSTVTDILEIMVKAAELDYPSLPKCTMCSESVIEISCFPQHFAMRCAISFMYVDNYPCYKCLYCKCLVHEDIENEVDVVICPFCEIPMLKSPLTLENEASANLTGTSKKVSVFCNNDCLREVGKLNSIEQHAFVKEI